LRRALSMLSCIEIMTIVIVAIERVREAAPMPMIDAYAATGTFPYAVVPAGCVGM
jgi:hypothetical protein